MVAFSYIGVTGFQEFAEIEHFIPHLPLLQPRQFIAGVLVCSATLEGRTTRWPGFPPVSRLKNIMQRTGGGLLNFVHFNTAHPDTYDAEMIRIVEQAGANLDGIQLNINWPKTRLLKNFRELRPDVKIILQIGRSAFDDIEYDPHVLVDAMNGPYKGLVEYVLLDRSMGKGHVLDHDFLAPYVEAVQKHCPELGIGAAGGLCADNVDQQMTPLLLKKPGLNMDAQGRLQTDGHLDLDQAQQYLIQANSCCKRFPVT